MDQSSVNGLIQEIDGAFYEVNLKWLPRPGDLIDLFSFVDAASGHTARHFFEVVKVMHKMYDVSKSSNTALNGNHSVVVMVRPGPLNSEV